MGDILSDPEFIEGEPKDRRNLMFAKLFGRSPESAPAVSQQPRERFRPTLPPVEADQTHLDALTALITFGATPKINPSEASALIAVHLKTQGVEDLTSGGKIEVQPIIDALEASWGRIINTQETSLAIATLYDASVADLPIEPGVEADVWKGNAPSLEVTIDGRRTAPLAPNRSIPTGSVAQLVDWNRVAVRARLRGNEQAMGIIAEFLFGEPLCDTRDLSGERRTILEDAILREIDEKGGEVEDMALRIQKAARDARHAKIVRREAPRRALRSAASFLSRPFKGQR